MTKWVDVSVLVEITSLSATRLSEGVGSTGVRFDVNAKLEEKERRSGRVVVLFGLTVKTKPNVVKYDVEGSATLSGKDQFLDQMLKADPKSNVPFVFHRIYQHVFTTIFTMASFLGTVYPPPDLLFPGKAGSAVVDPGKVQPVGVAQTSAPPK